MSPGLPSESRALRKRAAESVSYFSSLFVDPLVSTIKATESGWSVCRSKTATSCGAPLSVTWKSSLRSEPTSWPELFLAVATIRTRLTLTRMTGDCCAGTPDTSAADAARRLAHNRRIAVPLSFHPHFAVDEVFFLPDGHQLLETVNTFQRRVEGCLAMWGRDNHCHAGFADEHAAEPMHHGDAGHRVGGGYFTPDVRHHFERHAFVALVVQVQRGA